MHARSLMRTAAAAATILTLGVLAASGSAAQPATTTGSLRDPITYQLPGDQLFPEGMGYDATSGYFYTGSLTDGSIVRGSIYAANAETFLPAGGNGRKQTLGVRPAGHLLYVAGGASGRVWVYDIRTKRLLGAMRTGAKRTLTNDIAVAPNGAAYVTDSYSPFLYRVTKTRGVYRMTKFVDFRGTAFRYSTKPSAINADGIAIAARGRYVLVNALTAGALYRIDTQTRKVTRIRVPGAPLTNADGMVLDGTTLYVTRNANGTITKLKLFANFTKARRTGSITSPMFHFPTGLGLAPGRLLVLNAQLDKLLGAAPGTKPNPDLPFTVTSVVR